MIPLSAADIAAAVHGRVRGVDDAQAVVATSADTDSRNITENSLFIAKPGDVTDGHRFIDTALQSGAVLVLAERETDTEEGQPHPAVIVDDVVTAMGYLAAEIVRRIRAHSPTTVVGITGSAGKTTTKDLLAQLLSAEGPTVWPQGSYNGEVGVPLTVFTASLETRYLIIEMGADASGNIAELCRIVNPDIGVVLMVGSAHAGKFGGAEKIAETKGELAEYAGSDVLLNIDDPQVSAMAPRATAPITWFGEHEDAGVRATEVVLDEAGHPVLTLHLGTAQQRITSGLTGTHHVTNVLAAAAAAYAAGAVAEDIATRLHGLGPSSRWRMERTEIPWGGQDAAVTLINDAYNANPESMREALRTLAVMTRDSGRRSVAVLGGMLELGEASVMKHHDIGETVVRLNIDQTLVVGETAYPLYRGAIAEGSWGSEVHWVQDADEAHRWLSDHMAVGDVVLFKSSRDAGLRLLGDRIAAQEGTE